MPREESKFWEMYCTNIVKINSDMRKWNCRFCGKDGKGTKTQMIAHVGHIANKGASPCLAATPELIQEARAEAGESSSRVLSSSNTDIDIINFCHEMVPAETSPLPDPSSPVYSSDRPPMPKRSQTKLKGRSVLTIKKIEHAMEMEVRCFVEANLSFNLLKLPCWIKMIEAFSQVGETCSGVSYTAMRTTRLKKTLADVTAKCDHVKATWPKYSCTIMSDGWVDVNGRGLINILVSSAYGTMFLKTVDCSSIGLRVDGAWLAEKMKEAIMEVGKENVVQIVTDNASTCVAMGNLVEQEFPTIVRTPCASHCLDLLLEDIGNLDWVKVARTKANTITLFFKKRKNAKSIFRYYSLDLTILRPSKTRFGVIFIIIQRLITLWPALQQTVVSDFWRNWNDSKTAEAKTVQNYILDPTTRATFECVVKVMEPLYRVLRLTDIERAARWDYCSNSCKDVKMF